MERAVASVLKQDHEDLELVICDNASTDETEDFCQHLARADSRVVYRRQARNVGHFNNFVCTLRAATGEFFRWISDDDELEPRSLSRSLEVFASDPRLLLVTTQVSYTGDDGGTQTRRYVNDALGSDDRIERFSAMVQLLTESYLLIDPLYGLFRRDRVATIPRRNMLYRGRGVRHETGAGRAVGPRARGARPPSLEVTIRCRVGPAPRCAVVAGPLRQGAAVPRDARLDRGFRASSRHSRAMNAAAPVPRCTPCGCGATGGRASTVPETPFAW